MRILNDKRYTLFLILALVMAATRFHFPNPALHLADASWAVLFLAGFYLAKEWRWAFPLLMVEAVAIDYAAIQYLGISNYCVTVAYWFLLPSYGALWLGGTWLQKHQAGNARTLVLLAVSLFISVSVCFAIGNGSFYWLGGRTVSPSWAGYVEHFEKWYLPFMRVPLLYVGAALVLHVLVTQLQALSRRPKTA